MNPILGGVAPIPYTTAKTVAVYDGNSLVFGVGATGGQNLPTQQAALPPISGGLTFSNTAVSGQSINDMRTRGPTFVDPLFDSSKNNVLVLWEGTNSICNTGRTGLQAASDMTAYIAERRAVNPGWRIVLLTTIPRFNVPVGNIVARNGDLMTYDAYLLANYKAMGADSVVDVRSNPIFAYIPGSTTMSAAMTPYSSDGHTHLNNAGYALIAAMVSPALRRLPRPR